MIYLRSFNLLTADDEWQFFRKRSRGCYDSFYPYQFFPQQKELEEMEFSDITIFCGGNGSGKSTILNIIAEKLELKRETPYNKTDFFDPYINGCRYEFTEGNPEKKRDIMKVSRIITSDDVFNHIISVRERNENLRFKREVTSRNIAEIKQSGWKYGPRGFNAEDPEDLKSFLDYYQKLRGSSTKYIRANVGVDERTYSNGENGFKYFIDAIQPGGLYLLDEPENSLSAEFQLELVQFIQNMARFYDCQFIMSTHSPFILSLPFARIYNMDELPVKICKWTELPNVRLYYDFFMNHSEEFKITEEKEISANPLENDKIEEDVSESEEGKSNILSKDINTLREGFVCYCKLLGLRQDTCLALTLLLSTKESLIAMMQFMAKLYAEGVQKDMDVDDITTIVVNKAEEVRNWEDRQDPNTLHY